MKRLVTITAILAAAATMTQAQTNQVLSRNAVGYVKLRIPPAGGFNLVAVNFTAIGGTNTTLADQLATQLRKSNNPASADRVHIYDPNLPGYVQYAVRNSDTQFHNTANYSGPATNPVIPSGKAFWLQSPAAITTESFVYVMGEVPDFPSNLVAVLGSGSGGGILQQFGNPYPVDMNLDSLINTNDGARANNNPASADRIYLWDESVTNYVQLGLRNSDNRWHYTTNYSGPAADRFLSPGDGAWYLGRTNFLWVENKSYTYP